MSFAELTLCERENQAGGSRRVRIYAPNILDLEALASSIDEIELGSKAGLVLEDQKGIVVGWLLPGEKLTEVEFTRLNATRAHLIKLTKRIETRVSGDLAA